MKKLANGHGETRAGDDERTLELARPRGTGPWLVEVGSARSASATLLDERELIVGSGRDVDLRIEDRAVSSRHARIVARGRAVLVEDLGSRNGVFVGGVRVAAATIGADGGSVVLGRSTVVVRPSATRAEPARVAPLPGVIGECAAMCELAAEVRRHASARVPILLQGESGAGKDVVARAVHDLSDRRGPFVPLNVAALPGSLAEAELFGHLKGAFTGAVDTRVGAFEAAHRGTLFLDEIADLELSVQAKLLRVAEDGCVRPIGAESPVRVDARLVSASWANLEHRVRDGRFRADLLHRLATVVVRVPPLRERRSDLPALAEALLARHEGDVGHKQLSSAALSRLQSYSWPGNVRELSSVLYRAAAATVGDVIDVSHVQRALPGASDPNRSALGPADARALLAHHAGNISAAARAAGVARSTFRAWLGR